MPQGFDERAVAQPPAGPLPSNYVGQRPPRSRPWSAISLVLTAVVAVAALLIALMRPASDKPIASSLAPTYSAADVAAAQKQLCDTYQLLARAVEVDSNGTGKALARIADTNGAAMLNIASAAALNANHRDAARALAMAYGTVTAMGNNIVASDADYRTAVGDVVAKDAAMKKVCGGG